MIVLITGAAGLVGSMLTEPLRADGHVVRRTDLHASPGIDKLDVTDPAAIEAACAGVDAIVHMAGIASESTYEAIAAINVAGTRNVLAGAAATGVRRVILASSNHAVGFYRRSELPPGVTELADPLAPRPDTYYGWSKAAGEAIGAMYADRYGLDVIALRIGSCFPEPTTTRMLATWLAPVDAGRLVVAAVRAEVTGFRAVFGVSDNTRRWWSLDGAAALGFTSVDDAERFAARLVAKQGELDPDADEHDYVGGAFASAPLGMPMG